MDFKKSNDSFEIKGNFIDSTVRFISEDAVFIIDDDKEDLGEGFEGGLELVAMKSADKERENAKNVDRAIKNLNENINVSNKAIKSELKSLKTDEELLRVREEKLMEEQALYRSKLMSGQMSYEEKAFRQEKILGEERYCSVERERIDNRRNEINEAKVKKQAMDKEKKEARRKAATKTSIANDLKRTKEVKKDISGSAESSGNAFIDGSSGTVGIILDAINPVTYLKHLGMTIGVSLVPYIILIMGIVVVIMTIVAILGMALD